MKPFDFNTKVQRKVFKNKKTYTEVFADTLIKLAEHDKKIIGITAAMPSGTGMNLFGNRHPDRMFDVGIAEQHAVTFAAGMAVEGFKPFVCIYSTFLQRAYDQLVHDVALQSLPVRFAIDRAGLVGADGPTHGGVFDIAYLANLPNFIVMAPSDESELVQMIMASYKINDRPSAFRFPKGEVLKAQSLKKKIPAIKIGCGKIVIEGEKVAILSFGTRLVEAIKAHKFLKEKKICDITVADARFAKPLDEYLITKLAKTHKILITIEEGMVGGFGSHVAYFLSQKGLLDGNLKFRSLFLPDTFIEHGIPDAMYENAGLNASFLIKEIKKLLSK